MKNNLTLFCFFFIILNSCKKAVVFEETQPQNVKEINFFPKKYNPFVNKKMEFYDDLPMFCAGRSEAHYRMLDSLSNSKRFFLTISEMTHNDFTSQGAVGRYFCKNYVIDKEKYEEHNHKKCQYIREKGGWDCFNMTEIERIPVMMVRKPEYWRCYFDCQIHARKSHQPIAQR